MVWVSRNKQLALIDPHAEKSFIAALAIIKAELGPVGVEVGFFQVPGEDESRNSFLMEQITRAIGATIK
jgi:hypothetical protein